MSETQNADGQTETQNADGQDVRIVAIDEERHATGQRNALGTIIGCMCEWCTETIHAIEHGNTGHKIQGV